MLVRLGRLGDRVHVHAPLVRERARSDKRLSGTVAHVRRLVDEAGEFREVRGPSGIRATTKHRVARQLDREVCHDRDQIGVATPFTDAVDRALHLDGARGDGGKRIRDGHVAVVVAVDGHGHIRAASLERRRRLADQPRDFLGQCAAVGVTEHDPRGTRPGCRSNRLGRVVAVELPAVEEVLGVVEDLAAGVDQKLNRIKDHGEVFLT